MVNITTGRGTVAAIAAEQYGEDVNEHGSRHWEFAGDCTSPVHMHAVGRPDKLLVGLGIEPDRSLAAFMDVRCRKCERCLAHRARLWAARGASEIAAADRTWFGTLTLSPEQAVRGLYAAQAETLRGGCRWADLEPSEQCNARAKQVAPELARFMKRVRKNSGAKLRYLLVTEAHKSGVPHWHILIHEWQSPARKLVLERAWRLGFSHWRLVREDDARASWYACKYLSKSLQTRVRASREYGRASEVRITEERIKRTTRVIDAIAAHYPRSRL